MIIRLGLPIRVEQAPAHQIIHQVNADLMQDQGQGIGRGRGQVGQVAHKPIADRLEESGSCGGMEAGVLELAEDGRFDSRIS